MAKNDIEHQLERIMEKEKKEIQKKVDKAIPKFEKNLAYRLKKQVYKMFNEVVDEFYASYTPRFYQRNKRTGMRSMLKVRIDGPLFIMEFDENALSYRNGYSGEDGLYTTVFREGWHGGAQLGGDMLVPYRTTNDGKPISYNGTERNEWSNAKWQSPYKKYHSRWQQAERAPISPLENFNKKKEEYEKNGVREDIINSWNDAWKKSQ